MVSTVGARPQPDSATSFNIPSAPTEQPGTSEAAPAPVFSFGGPVTRADAAHADSEAGEDLVDRLAKEGEEAFKQSTEELNNILEGGGGGNDTVMDDATAYLKRGRNPDDSDGEGSREGVSEVPAGEEWNDL